MGIGFTVDNAPDFFLRKPTDEVAEVAGITAPVMGPWEQIDQYRAMTLMEEAPYETTEIYEIKVVPVKRVSIDYIGIPYSAFGRFRERLWQQIRPPGKPVLGLMQGFMPSTALEIYRLREGHDLPIYSQPEDYKLFEGEMSDWWHLHAANWDDVESPLRHLIHHSDCDGDLSPEQCREVAPALREAVSSWNEGDYEREFAENLANAMDICAENNRRLIFS